MDDRITEWQVIRMDGTVLMSWLVPPGGSWYWSPVPGSEIRGLCMTRYRIIPDGSWHRGELYPAGFPGEPAPWPLEGRIGLVFTRIPVP